MMKVAFKDEMFIFKKENFLELIFGPRIKLSYIRFGGELFSVSKCEDFFIGAYLFENGQWISLLKKVVQK